MKRLCFDTESSYYFPGGYGVQSAEAIREYYRDKTVIQFHCAVVYDESADQYYEFRSKEAGELVAMLSGADEIISHSGSRSDLVVLEHACGEERLAQFRQLKHHDLLDMGNWKSLETLTKQFLPDRTQAWEADYKRRIEQANALEEGSFIAGKLVKARYDVERTYAVFLELSRRQNL